MTVVICVCLAALSGNDASLQVFGGGPVLTANPEPYAEFFDVILLGDGEGILADFTQAMQAAVGGSGTREELLISLSQVVKAAHQMLCCVYQVGSRRTAEKSRPSPRNASTAVLA